MTPSPRALQEQLSPGTGGNREGTSSQDPQDPVGGAVAACLLSFPVTAAHSTVAWI